MEIKEHSFTSMDSDEEVMWVGLSGWSHIVEYEPLHEDDHCVKHDFCGLKPQFVYTHSCIVLLILHVFLLPFFCTSTQCNRARDTRQTLERS